MLTKTVFCLLLVSIVGSYAQNVTTCECALLIDEDRVLLQLETWSKTQVESCTVDDETACAENCNTLGENFDQNFNLSNSYPNDSQGRTYGQVYCRRANETLGDAYIGGIWNLNTESLLSGDECLFPTFWQPAFFHTEVLCCNPEGNYDPNCGA